MNPNAPSTNRILLALLESGQPAISSRQLGEMAGVSQRAASDVMRFLEFHGGLSSKRQIRWRRTATILSMLRLASMDPARTIRTGLDGVAACPVLQTAGIPAALAFTTAANEWAFFEPHPESHLLVPRGTASQAAAALDAAASPDQDDRSVTLFEADLDSTGTTKLRDVTLTTRLQTWIDLARFPRAGAHEAFFRSVIRDEYPQAGEL